MRRKALLIGNTNGLAGVKVDISNFKTFLNSNHGGQWYDSEIEIISNPRKSSLLIKIDEIKRQSNDYTVVLFSGHGGHSQYKRKTILEINGDGETIYETDLNNLSKRQLNIYDCCRTLASLHKTASDSLRAEFSESINTYRPRFEKRIMEADEQQAILYSCSIGQVSYDTENGGVYFSNFLKSAKNVPYGNEFKLVGLAHEEAVPPTIEYSKKLGGLQEPEAILAKSLSSRQLIIALR